MLTRFYITLILFIVSFNSFCQLRYQVSEDTVNHICSILEINDKAKTFGEYFLGNCDRAKFFADNKVLVYWDKFGRCNFADLSFGLKFKEDVYFGDVVKDVISIEPTKEKYDFTKNGVPTTDNNYIVKYLNKSGTICEMMIDKHWFVKLTDTCK